MKVTELLNEHTWAQGWYAFDSTGDPVRADSDYAKKYSLMGAILACYPEDYHWEKVNLVASVVRIAHKQRIEEFNDSATWDQMNYILSLLDL